MVQVISKSTHTSVVGRKAGKSLKHNAVQYSALVSHGSDTGAASGVDIAWKARDHEGVFLV